MVNPSQVIRIESALRADKPEEALVLLAAELKTEGLEQREMYELFEAQLLQHRDSNELLYQAIADAMDRIVGWCRPELRLFDTEL